MRIEPPRGDSHHAAPNGQVLRRLEPQAGLLIDADVAKFYAVGIPLIGIRLMDQARSTIPERVVDPLLPEVRGLDNVGIRRNELVGRHHDTPPVMGEALLSWTL